MRGEIRSGLHATYESLGAHFSPWRECLLPERFDSVESECRAVRELAGVADRTDLAYLTASGKDAQRFLQGMVTNDVNALSPGQGAYAAHLNPQGHLIADFHLLAMPDHYLMETIRPRLEPLRASLDHFVIADDVEFQDRSDQLAALSVEGPASGKLLTAAGAAVLPGKDLNHTWMEFPTPGAEGNKTPVLVVRLSETGEEGYRLIFLAEFTQNIWDILAAQQEQVAWKPIGHAALNTLRVEAGIPWYGMDMEERTLLPEAGLEERAISYTKGCYIGQEIIERIRSRGHVNRRLAGFFLGEGPMPSAGAKLLSNGKEVGHLTSVVRSPVLGKVIALGYVRREYLQPGTQLALGKGGTAEVGELPFYRSTTN